MKRILLILAALVLLPVLSWAQTYTVSFAFDYPSPGSDLAGFRIYQSATSGSYTYGPGKEVVTVPKTDSTAKVSTAPGRWFWVITAYDTVGNESSPSNEVTENITTSKPGAPSGLTIKIIIKVQP